MFLANQNFFETESNILPSNNSIPIQSNQDTINEEIKGNPAVNELDLDLSCDEIRPNTSYKKLFQYHRSRFSNVRVGYQNEFKETSEICLRELLQLDKKDILENEMFQKKIKDFVVYVPRYYDKKNGNKNQMFSAHKQFFEHEFSILPSITSHLIQANNIDRNCGNVVVPVHTNFDRSKKVVNPKQVRSDKDEKQFTCEICNKVFSSKGKLKSHITIVHEGRKPFTRLKAHIDSVHEKKKPFLCETCNERFKTKQILLRHIASKHIRKGPYQCATCNSEFEEKRGLNEHVSSVHGGINPFKCDLCESTFARQNGLNRHKRSVHEKTTTFLYCQICNKGFSQKHHLKSHIAIVHEGIRPFQCNVCGSTYGVKSKLKLHVQAVHKGKKPFPCSKCDKQFYTSTRLREHIEIIHEGKDNANAECEICNEKFTHVKKLRYHMNRFHEGKNFVCDLCSIAFLTRFKLKAHIEAVHEGKKPYQCEFCEKSFSKKPYLISHVSTLHPIKIQNMNYFNKP